MIGSKLVALMALLTALVGGAGFYFQPATAAEGEDSQVELPAVPGQPQPVVPTEPPGSVPAPKAPIKFKTVDFQDAGQGTGKIKLAGVAQSGTPLYLFFDDQPFAKVAADEQGAWSVEGEMTLDDKPHTLRAEQYDPETRMLAGRAMITIGRTREDAGDAAKGGTPPPAPQ